MKTFFTHLVENNDFPLMYSYNEDEIVINREKWDEIFKDKSSYVIDDHLITFQLKKSGSEGIPAKFNDEPFSTRRLVMSYIPDDYKASSNLLGRTGRFPNRENKKENKRGKNTIIFGSSTDRDATHTLEIPLKKISDSLEDPEKRNVSASDNPEGISKIVTQNLRSMIQPEYLERSDYKFKPDPGFIGKLTDLLKVFHSDYENLVSNIKYMKILTIPPKKEIVRKVNEQLAKSGSNQSIVGFSSIKKEVEEALSHLFGIDNAGDIFDQSGERYYYLLMIGTDDKNSGFTLMTPLEFYKKHYKVFSNKNWPAIEKHLRVPSKENYNKIIRLLRKNGISFNY